MFKHVLKRIAPRGYSEVRDAYYAVQGWAHQQVRERDPQKRAEFTLRRMAAHVADIPLDVRKPKILFGPIEGYPLHVVYMALLGLRLRAEGHAVEVLTCRRNLSFCTTGQFERKALPCEWCIKLKEATMPAAFPRHDWGAPSDDCRSAMADVAHMDLASCLQYEWRGFPIGNLARVSVCWFNRKGSVEEADLPTYREAIQSALLVADRFPIILDTVRPDRVVLLNGYLYTAALPLAICKARGVVCYTYETGQFPGSVLVSRDGPAAAHAVDDSYALIQHVPLDAAARNKVLAYFHARRYGKTLRYLWGKPTVAPSDVQRELGLDGRPVAVAFANTSWDTAILGEDTIFKGGHDWLTKLVQHFASRTEWLLLVRCHPAEHYYKQFQSQDRVEKELPRRVPQWPANVKIIPSESPISSYTLMDLARCGLVYTSTTGMEMIHWRKPVVAAGRGRIYKKGIVEDPDTQQAYFAAVERLMANATESSDAQRENLYRFAYHYFFERHLPFEPVRVDPLSFAPYLTLRSLSALRRLRSGGFVEFCRAVADGRHAIIGPRRDWIHAQDAMERRGLVG